MARQAKTGEKANAPIKLRPSVKKKLADWRDQKNLATFDNAISILLDIAEKCEYELDIKINAEPSVTYKGG